MKTVNIKSPFSYIPGYSKNAVLQLILVCATAFVLYHGIRVVMLMVGVTQFDFVTNSMPNVAIFTLPLFKTHFWTILTYGWLHNGFWELVTNMLWLYCFGNLVQILIGQKQVVPIFLYSVVTGGLFFMLCQLIPGEAFKAKYFLLGSQAGLAGMATAAITLAPGYRFFIGDRLRIHILVVAGIFFFLMLLNTHLLLPQLFLLAGGALTGFLYMTLLRKGYRPGAWMHSTVYTLQNMVTPNEAVLEERKRKKREHELKKLQAKQDLSQKHIDEILDKINQKGYSSLSEEEKEVLHKASKEK